MRLASGSESVEQSQCFEDRSFNQKVVVVDFVDVAADEHVDTLATVELIGRSAAIQRVVAFLSVQRVNARATNLIVGSVAAKNCVCPGFAVDCGV